MAVPDCGGSASRGPHVREAWAASKVLSWGSPAFQSGDRRLRRSTDRGARSSSPGWGRGTLSFGTGRAPREPRGARGRGPSRLHLAEAARGGGGVHVPLGPPGNEPVGREGPWFGVRLDGPGRESGVAWHLREAPRLRGAVHQGQQSRLPLLLLYDKVYRTDILAHAYALVAEGGRTRRGRGDLCGHRGGLGGACGWPRAGGAAHGDVPPSPVRRVLIPSRAGSGNGHSGFRPFKTGWSDRRRADPAADLRGGSGAHGLCYRPGARPCSRPGVHRALCAGHTEVMDADPVELLRLDSARRPHAVAGAPPERSTDVAVAQRRPLKRRGGAGAGRWVAGPRGEHAMRGTPQAGWSRRAGHLYMNRYLKVFRGGVDRRSGRGSSLCRRSRGALSSGALRSSRRPAGGSPDGPDAHEQKTRVCDGRREPFTFLAHLRADVLRKDGHWYLGRRPPEGGAAGQGRIRVLPGTAPWDEVWTAHRVLRGWATLHLGTRLLPPGGRSYVYERVRPSCGGDQVPSRGTRRFPIARVFRELGVLPASCTPASPAHAGCDPSDSRMRNRTSGSMSRWDGLSSRRGLRSRVRRRVAEADRAPLLSSPLCGVPASRALRRTCEYASRLRRAALHLGLFERPGISGFFNYLRRAGGGIARRSARATWE